MMLFDKLFSLLTEGSAIRSYSCFMLDLSFLSNDILKIHESISSDDIYDDEPGHGLEKETHVTIKYGLHEQTPSNFFDKIELYPIKLKFDNLSLFENEKFDVLKFSIISKDLKKMNKFICDNFTCTDSYPVYKPHCTIGYLKPGTGKKYLKLKNTLSGNTFESSKFIFSNAMSDKVFVDFK